MIMKTRSLVATVAILCVLNYPLSSAMAQGTAITYQGQLNDGANLANGTYDMRFHVYNAATGGSVLAGPVTNLSISVSNGLFTTLIDFGPGVFTGSSNWLQIGVRTNGAASFISFSQRQQLTPVPYAIFAEGVNAAGLTGSIPSGDLSGTYGSVITLNNPANVIDGNGNGLTDLNATQLTGLVPYASLPANLAFLDSNQTFTANNIFNTGSSAGRLTVQGSTGIDTNFFTPWVSILH